MDNCEPVRHVNSQGRERWQPRVGVLRLCWGNPNDQGYIRAWRRPGEWPYNPVLFRSKARAERLSRRRVRRWDREEWREIEEDEFVV